jgi:DNA-binding transcriptional MerR regulator
VYDLLDDHQPAMAGPSEGPGPMFKIGEFSRLARVTVKALRFYDETGLLEPIHVDEQSGYRYYSADQLKRLYRILALKELGLSLEQIRDLLRRGAGRAEMCEVLAAKRRELEARVRDEELLLSRVEARLRQIEEGNELGTSEVVIKQVDPMLVASVRGLIPNYPSVGTLMGELFKQIGKSFVRPAGPCLSRWHDPEYKESDVDGEAVVPIGRPIKEIDRVKCYTLPSETMACIVHHGAYNSLSQSYDALNAWIVANGYRPAGACREVYLYCGNGRNVRQDDESYVTEIQCPVEKV